MGEIISVPVIPPYTEKDIEMLNFIKDKTIMEFSLFYLILFYLCWFGFCVLYFCLVVFLYYKLPRVVCGGEISQELPNIRGLG